MFEAYNEVFHMATLKCRSQDSLAYSVLLSQHDVPVGCFPILTLAPQYGIWIRFHVLVTF